MDDGLANSCMDRQEEGKNPVEKASACNSSERLKAQESQASELREEQGGGTSASLAADRVTSYDAVVEGGTGLAADRVTSHDAVIEGGTGPTSVHANAVEQESSAQHVPFRAGLDGETQCTFMPELLGNGGLVDRIEGNLETCEMAQVEKYVNPDVNMEPVGTTEPAKEGANLETVQTNGVRGAERTHESDMKEGKRSISSSSSEESSSTGDASSSEEDAQPETLTDSEYNSDAGGDRDWIAEEAEVDFVESEGEEDFVGGAGEGQQYDMASAYQHSEKLPPVPKVDLTLRPNESIEKLGRISSVVGNVVVVETMGYQRFMDAGSVLWLLDGNVPLGLVDDIFGPVKKPLYSVRFNNVSEIPAGACVGAVVGYVAAHVTYVMDDGSLHKKGCDASGRDDTELPEEDFEFSDDEKEAEVRKEERKKRRRRKAQNKREREALALQMDSGPVGADAAAPAPAVGRRQENVPGAWQGQGRGATFARGRGFQNDPHKQQQQQQGPSSEHFGGSRPLSRGNACGRGHEPQWHGMPSPPAGNAPGQWPHQPASAAHPPPPQGHHPNFPSAQPGMQPGWPPLPDGRPPMPSGPPPSYHVFPSAPHVSQGAWSHVPGFQGTPAAAAAAGRYPSMPEMYPHRLVESEQVTYAGPQGWLWGIPADQPNSDHLIRAPHVPHHSSHVPTQTLAVHQPLVTLTAPMAAISLGGQPQQPVRAPLPPATQGPDGFNPRGGEQLQAPGHFLGAGAAATPQGFVGWGHPPPPGHLVLNAEGQRPMTGSPAGHVPGYVDASYVPVRLPVHVGLPGAFQGPTMPNGGKPY